MVEEDAVALVLDRVAAGDDVDQQAAAREAVERRRHARRQRSATAGPGRTATRNFSRSVTARQRRGDDPGVLAGAAGRQQHAVVAELVGGLRDLVQIVEVDVARAFGRCRGSGRRRGSGGTRGC